MRICGLKTNHLVGPLGFDLKAPRVSFYVEDTEGKRPEAIRIQVSLDEDFGSLLYDSGRSSQLSMLGTKLPISLSPRTRYYWRAEVWADNGDYAISDTAWFETGKMDEGWAAKWIGASLPGGQPPMLVRDFETTAPCAKGRVYACGLGLYELYLDGKKIGDEFLAPGCCEYDRWLPYQTYAVTLAPGPHRLEAWLGDGWYKGRFGLDHAENVYGDRHKLILELVMEDPADQTIVTDEQWYAVPCPVISSSIYDGEVYDPGIPRLPRLPVEVLRDGTDLLCARHNPPVVIKETRTPLAVLHTPAGETVLDMGQNMAGFVRFQAWEPAGTRLRLQFGEILQDGNFYRDNLRTAKAEFVYLSDGTPREVRPHFTYYGFRYVKLEGFSGEVTPERFTGCVLYSDLAQTGWISTSNEKVNRLISNALWGQKSNYVDVPTDCPQRDERMGWTADAQIFSATACFNMDCYCFLRKYCRDIYETQQKFGHVTNVVPAFHEDGPACSVWGDAATIIPWNLYRYYGDKTILAEQYDSMKQWVDYIRSIDAASGDRRRWDVGFHFGDWLALDGEGSDTFKGATEDGYIATAYYYHSASLVAKAAALLGKNADAERYGQLAREIKEALQREYFTPNGRLALTTQTAYALALYMDFAPEGSKPRLAELLLEKLKVKNGYLQTGFVGTSILNQVLSDNGCGEMAYKLLLNEEYPSWLYAVNLGATTVWERWNSVLPDGRLGSTDMNSLNHYAYGSIVGWMYRNMAGLRLQEDHPGFTRVTIAPQPDYRVTRCDMTYLSTAGPYEIHWQVAEDGSFSMRLKIPFGAEADVVLPNSAAAPMHVDSGAYEFHYMPQTPIKKAYSCGSTLTELLEHPAAKALITAYLPQWETVPLPLRDLPLEQLNSTPFSNLTDAQCKTLDAQLKAL